MLTTRCSSPTLLWPHSAPAEGWLYLVAHFTDEEPEAPAQGHTAGAFRVLTRTLRDRSSFLCRTGHPVWPCGHSPQRGVVWFYPPCDGGLLSVSSLRLPVRGLSSPPSPPLPPEPGPSVSQPGGPRALLATRHGCRCLSSVPFPGSPWERISCRCDTRWGDPHVRRVFWPGQQSC